MQELMFMLAKVMPFDKLLTMLKESIEKYESDPTDDNKKHIGFNCMLLTSHEVMENKDMAEVMKEATHMRKISERFRDEKVGS